MLIELYSMSQVQRFCLFHPPSQYILVPVQTNIQVNTLQRGFYLILTSGTSFVYLQGFLYNRNQGAVHFSMAVRYRLTKAALIYRDPWFYFTLHEHWIYIVEALGSFQSLLWSHYAQLKTFLEFLGIGSIFQAASASFQSIFFT